MGRKKMHETTDFIEASPLDEHNRRLLANVRPGDWSNPQPAGRYNLAVVGAGTAGLVAAAGAAGLGAKVALIERRLMGGDCLNTGCVPSKALLRAARSAHDAGHPRDSFFAEAMERMRRLRAGLSGHDSAERFRGLGVDVYFGEARFRGGDAVEVAGQTLTFARACIATGGRAARPAIAGLEEAGFLTNESVFSLTELPRRLAILGGGPIGCELAQAFARLGAEVSIIEKHERLLGKEDARAAEIVRSRFIAEGIELALGAQVESVAASSAGKRLALKIGDARRELVVDEILVAAGRTPNVAGMGLEAAGVEYDDRRGIVVDDYLRTSNRRIFAAGDCCSAQKFTHLADAQARIVVQNALFFGRSRVSKLTIPRCTYTDPEVAHVGLDPVDASARGIALDTITVDMTGVDRAVLDGETEGFLNVYLQRGGDRILGATLVAANAGDILGELSLAIDAKIGMKRIARVIHASPTQAEIVKRAADAYNRTRLTPGVKSLFEALLRWRR